MSKNSDVFVFVEPELKRQAEVILNQMGLPISLAISLFLRQVVSHQEMSFLPVRPPSLDALSAEQLNAELEKGFADIEAGRVRPAEEFFSELERKYGV